MRYGKGLYWIVTGLMAAFMLMASIPDILRIPQAVDLFRHLGYPTYLLPFLGTAKIIAVIVILAPGVLWLKEWAYAGLIFDLVGAFYSHLCVGDPPSAWAFPVIGLCLVAGSYLVYRKQAIATLRQTRTRYGRRTQGSSLLRRRSCATER